MSQGGGPKCCHTTTSYPDLRNDCCICSRCYTATRRCHSTVIKLQRYSNWTDRGGYSPISKTYSWHYGSSTLYGVVHKFHYLGGSSAAHRCNLAYRISKSEWKLPIVMHTLKGSIGHLIVKALKSEFGEARVIPQNMEKYLSITLERLKSIHRFSPIHTSEPGQSDEDPRSWWVQIPAGGLSLPNKYNGPYNSWCIPYQTSTTDRTTRDVFPTK